jgi:hypothetical protein
MATEGPSEMLVITHMGFEVFMAVNLWIAVFWITMPSSLAGDYKRFGGTYRFHLQGHHDPLPM